MSCCSVGQSVGQSVISTLATPRTSAHQASLSFTGMTGVLLRREEKNKQTKSVHSQQRIPYKATEVRQPPVRQEDKPQSKPNMPRP